MARRRVDQLLVERGLAPSRNRAQALILAGSVLTDAERRIEKPGEMLAENAALRLKGEAQPFVSRGGLKLQGALGHFNVDVSKKVCMDVGASTGGFTDCLLQRGASRVYAIDVGYGQMAWSMRQDERVIVHERTNIRHLQPTDLPEPCSVIVVDVSFISLKKILLPALQFATEDCWVVCLVKPQFEVGRAHVGKGGIVRDQVARQSALEDILSYAQQCGLGVLGSIVSPIQGAKGNIEYLMAARRQG